MLKSEKFTNESLAGILNSMKVTSDDKILSVANDAAFAMLASGAEVTAVNNNQKHIDFMIKRHNYLKEGDIGSFLHISPGSHMTSIGRALLEARNEYLKDNFLDMKENIDNMELLYDDIFEVADPSRGFNKAYLSNTLTYSYPVKRGSEKYIKNLQKIIYAIPEKGIIYMADGVDMRGDDSCRVDFQKILPANIALEEDLSWISQIEHRDLPTIWYPSVFRKDSSIANKIYKTFKLLTN